MTLDEKFEKLKEILAGYESVLVAFSGGCDSAFAARAARDVLGRAKMSAVTSRSESLPESEIEEVTLFCREQDIPHFWVVTHELDNPDYAANPVNRCYFCKTELYQHLQPQAEKLHIKTIVNGVNVDDLGDWRPGLIAAKEFHIKSPLVEAGLCKTEIRELSRRLGLKTWDKPAAACLSSRFPYGHAVTAEKLRVVDQGEAFMKSLGLRILRLRHFGNAARLEFGTDELDCIKTNPELEKTLISGILNLGFDSVEIDPSGYRQGSMNRLVPQEQLGAGRFKNAE